MAPAGAPQYGLPRCFSRSTGSSGSHSFALPGSGGSRHDTIQAKMTTDVNRQLIHKTYRKQKKKSYGIYDFKKTLGPKKWLQISILLFFISFPFLLSHHLSSPLPLHFFHVYLFSFLFLSLPLFISLSNSSDFHSHLSSLCNV